MDAKHSLGEPRCLISRTALLHNIALLRKTLAPSTKICAVVKANAYGHGADLVADTLCNFTATDSEPPMIDALAVADIDEAAALLSHDTPITILRPIENAYLGRQRARLDAAIAYGWTLTVTSPTAAGDLASIALARSQRANVQMMVNTGMNRSGVDPKDFHDLLDRILSLPSLRLVGISTHFASADQPDNTYNADQLARFLSLTQPLPPRAAAARPILSAANSGGIFFHRESHLDMVRPGISIYGIDPTCSPNLDRPLRPTLRWTAPLIAIRDVLAGSSVGYNQTWTTPRPTRLGLVPIGYADGYPRSLSNRGVMLVDGHPAPIAGRVSMDLTIIDLQNAPHAMIGDEVTILDNDPLSPASVYKIAELDNTIPYEIFCRIGPRIRRIPIDDFVPTPPPVASAR